MNRDVGRCMILQRIIEPYALGFTGRTLAEILYSRTEWLTVENATRPLTKPKHSFL